MNIEYTIIENKVYDNVLKEISYEFKLKQDGNIITQTIYKYYYKDGRIVTEFYPTYDVLGDFNNILLDEINKLEKTNDIYSFYNSYKNIIHSLSFDFDLEKYKNSICLETIINDHQVRVNLFKSFTISQSYIQITKINKETNVVYVNRFIDVDREFKMENILKSNNRLKILLDNELIKFLEEFTKQI